MKHLVFFQRISIFLQTDPIEIEISGNHIQLISWRTNDKLLNISFFYSQCLEHCVCTLRNLSYRLESEIDRDRYDDADVDVDPATVKEQQSQGCFAGCGGRKKKKVPNDKRPMDRPKGPPQGVELLWQAQTVQQYYVLLRKAKNTETLEGSAGAIHNLTACSWKVRSFHVFSYKTASYLLAARK